MFHDVNELFYQGKAGAYSMLTIFDYSLKGDQRTLKVCGSGWI